MENARTKNLLGAFALVLSDRMTQETAARAGHGASMPAALVSIGVAPGVSIEALSHTLGLSHSATVRLVDRLAKEALVQRRHGSDGRSVGLHLTRKGLARRRKVLGGRDHVLEEALGSLSPKERATLTALLERILYATSGTRVVADHICRLCDEDVCPDSRCPVEQAVKRS